MYLDPLQKKVCEEPCMRQKGAFVEDKYSFKTMIATLLNYMGHFVIQRFMMQFQAWEFKFVIRAEGLSFKKYSILSLRLNGAYLLHLFRVVSPKRLHLKALMMTLKPSMVYFRRKKTQKPKSEEAVLWIFKTELGWRFSQLVAWFCCWRHMLLQIMLHRNFQN